MSNDECEPKFPKTRNVQKSRFQFLQSSDSEDDIGIKPSLSLNRRNRILDDSKEELESDQIYPSMTKEHYAHPNISSQLTPESNASKTETEEKKIIDSDGPETPKKCLKTSKSGNIVISDSDSSSPNCKSSLKRSPRKEWVGPDFKLNLKSLGLGKQLDPWIQSAKGRPIMSSVPVSGLSKHLLRLY